LNKTKREQFNKEVGKPYRKIPRLSGAFAAVMFLASSLHANAQTPELASWNDGPAKESIVSFVKEVTDRSGSKYVEPQDRIATFDQDGTLWVEHPLYAQAMFALVRLHELASHHPEWEERVPFKAVLANDHSAMANFSESDWTAILAVTYAGMISEAFQPLVRQWLATAKDARFHQPYTALVYQPMLEGMDYLRDNGFRTYIVTGGGQEFVRVYSQRVCGVPPERVVGSSILTKYEYQDGEPVLMRERKVFFIDDYAGKLVGINLFIGKRPYAAFGNSLGDKQMLEWAQAGGAARLMMLLLHDDPVREYAYGPADGLPETKAGTLTQAFYDEGKSKGWTIISMKNDY